MSDAENIITYIDDVLVHSANHTLHIQHLSSALSRIRAAHLRLNAKKCIFAATSVQYLGHTLSASGVRPGSCKIKAIRDCLPPTSQKQLKAFLGLANYFRNYIKGFSSLAAPLFALTRKSSGWPLIGPSLPQAALSAFHAIKSAISSQPVLAYPSPLGDLTLAVDSAQGDANNQGGMGAALLQQQPDGSNKPIGYASRQLLTYERNYPAFLLEMAAAVFGMDYFHHYLVGRPFRLLLSTEIAQHQEL